MLDRRNQKLNMSVINGHIHKISSALLWGGAALSMSSTIAHAQSRPAAAQAANKITGEDMLAYRMQKGDNLHLLAQRHMINAGSAQTVQRLNRIANPHTIPVGTVIRIPYRLLKYKPETARLVAWRGNVAIGRNSAPTIGMELGEGIAIATGQGGFVTLQLSNGSRVSIPSQSSVRIAKMREYRINGALDYELAVDKGRINTKATPLKNPDSRYRIRTPIAVSAVRGTEFRVKLMGNDVPSLTEVLEGTVAVGTPIGINTIDVPKGVGMAMTSNGDSSTEELLPAPELLSPGKVQKEETLSFTAQPLPGAARYRAVIATDASMAEVFDEAISDTPQITFPAIPNGKYFIRVSGFSPNGFEGFTNSYGFRRRLLTVGGAAEPADDGSVLFKWDAGGNGKVVHRFQLYRDAVTNTPYIDEAGLTKNEIKLNQLPPGTWFWRVGISLYEDGAVTENWTTPEKLTIAREE